MKINLLPIPQNFPLSPVPDPPPCAGALQPTSLTGQAQTSQWPLTWCLLLFYFFFFKVLGIWEVTKVSGLGFK